MVNKKDNVLDIKNLKKDVEKLEELTYHVIKYNNKEYGVGVRTELKKSEISSMKAKFNAFILRLAIDEEFSEYTDADIKITSENYALGMIIKYYTNLEISDEYEDMLIELTVLSDLGILENVIQLLPKGELEKTLKILTEFLDERADEIAEMNKQLDEQKEELAEQLKEKEEILDSLEEITLEEITEEEK